MKVILNCLLLYATIYYYDSNTYIYHVGKSFANLSSISFSFCIIIIKYINI